MVTTLGNIFSAQANLTQDVFNNPQGIGMQYPEEGGVKLKAELNYAAHNVHFKDPKIAKEIGTYDVVKNGVDVTAPPETAAQAQVKAPNQKTDIALNALMRPNNHN